MRELHNLEIEVISYIKYFGHKLVIFYSDQLQENVPKRERECVCEREDIYVYLYIERERELMNVRVRQRDNKK